MKMDASARTRILTELFGQDPGQLDISVVRLTLEPFPQTEINKGTITQNPGY